MAIFYAFCRIVDDIVDEPGYSDKDRHTLLDRWTQVVAGEAQHPNELENEVMTMIAELSLDTEPIYKIIEGCRSDIHQSQPETRRQLMEYCYHVASCVGLVSATIMGASKKADEYAVTLGYALQIVNIIRDLAEDYKKHKRVYIPAEDMIRFGYSEQDIAQSITSREQKSLLAHQATWADELFSKSDLLYNNLGKHDKMALRPAQAMALIYKAILEKMKKDGFKVFSKRYRVNTIHKFWLLARVKLIGN